LLEACGGQERRLGSAMITGVVRDRARGEPIPGASVHLEWLEAELVAPGRLGGRNRWVEASTDQEGRYTVCDAPGDQLIIVQATFLDFRSDTVHVRAPEDSYAVVDLVVELPPGLVRSGPLPSSSLFPQGQGEPENLREDDGLPEVLRRTVPQQIPLQFPSPPRGGQRSRPLR
jgi:hypothetical protein